MKRAFLFFWILLGKAQRGIMIFTSLVVVTLILVQVALRYFFKLPLMGVEELATMVGFWMYFIGSANGSRERSHIKADILQAFIKNPKTLFMSKALGNLVVTVLACIMVQWAVRYFQWSLKSWERSPALMIPMVYAQFSLVVSSFLMAFYFLVEFVDNTRQFFGKPPFALPDDEFGFACLAASSDKKEAK
jgi:TRAP-type C4-dicarboxylate transport system permease small subunit